MLFIILGFIISSIMGISGAGGALIAIPLFQQFLSVNFKEATILSLLAVSFGVFINLTDKIRVVRWPLALGLFLFGLVGNFLSLNFKALVPDLVIQLTLVLISGLSLYAIWKPSKYTPQEASSSHVTMMAPVGIAIGMLSSLTGLGGGVVILPVLIQIFRLPYEQAFATGLMTIFLISTSSYLIQMKSLTRAVSILDVSGLIVGGILANGLIKIGLKKVSPEIAIWTRKITFTIVTILAILLLNFK